MANPPPITLDVREPQIIRHYPLDGGGFFWHHRVLLNKISPGVFIALSPDLELERVDLHQIEYLPLERRSPFPAAQAPYVYAFDEMSRAELERQRRRANSMASLFNETPVQDIEAFEWMVCDPNREDFGERVDDDLVDQGVTMGDSGVIEKDGQEVFVRRVALSQKAEVILKVDSSRGDTRLLGLFKDGQGRRHLDFKKALDLLHEEDTPDWRLQGPKVMMEFLRSVRSGPGDLATYHLTWLKNSGVSQYSMISHDHRIICNVLRASLEIDQINAANSLALELLARRLVQIETAVARNPLAPDFSGLELMLEDPVGAGGEAVTSVFNTWVASKLKEKANVSKQARLYKEEFRQHGSGRGSQADDNPDVKGDRRGRGRGRGRTGRGQATGAES